MNNGQDNTGVENPHVPARNDESIAKVENTTGENTNKKPINEEEVQKGVNDTENTPGMPVQKTAKDAKNTPVGKADDSYEKPGIPDTPTDNRVEPENSQSVVCDADNNPGGGVVERK